MNTDNSKVAVLVELFADGRTRRFNVAKEMANLSSLGVDSMVTTVPAAKSGFNQLVVAGGVCVPFYEKICSIGGVISLRVERYSFTLTINPVFPWRDVEPAVLEAISQVIGKELEIEYDNSAKIAAEMKPGFAAVLIESLADVDRPDLDNESDDEPRNNAWGGLHS